MIWDDDRDEYVFSSGNRIYANGGIIGIDDSNPRSKLFYGYDGGVDWPVDEWNGSKLTKADMVELADAMIERWQAFKAGLFVEEITDE